MRPPSPVPVTWLGSMPFSARSRRTTGDRMRASSGRDPPGAEAPGAGGGGAAGGGLAGGGAQTMAGSEGCHVGGGAGAAGGGGGAAVAGGGAGGAGAGGCICGGGAAAVGGEVGGGGAAAGGGGGGAAAAGEGAAGAAPAGTPAPASPMTASRAPTSTVSPSGTRISRSTPSAGDGTSESTLSVDTSNRGSSRATVSPTAFIQRVIVPSVTVSPSCGIVTSANVQSPSGQRQHRLAEGLGEGRVRLDEISDIARRGLPVDGEVARTELLGDPRADQVHAEDPPRGAIGLPLGDDLHQPVGVADDACTAVAAEGIALGHHVEPPLDRLRLGQAGIGHLGVGVDGPWNPVVVDRGDGLTEHAAHGHDRLGETDVRQLRGACDQVADGPHPLGPGPLVGI